jgi:23S rRNA (cytidine1920-2'-O)/16S rRNA (cytidine1409-2'-O)-methyltransferase
LKRLDVYLVEKGLASSRTKAQELIEAGLVLISGKPVTASSTKVEDVEIEIRSNVLEKFVSRAGLKLEGALEHLKISVKNLSVLDLGQSTGGFTDCLLQRGAKEITGIEVGHDQLAAKLKSHPQIKTFEGLNARDLSILGKAQFDLIVGDLSFISMTYILSEAFKYLKWGGRFIFLVKPQFEVGPENLDKRGVVKDSSLYASLESKIKDEARKNGFEVKDYFPSVIDGKDGNKEFFIFCTK